MTAQPATRPWGDPCRNSPRPRSMTCAACDRAGIVRNYSGGLLSSVWLCEACA